MAKIIDKAFDATKKIVRAVFRGAPNLITTADLNRQFASVKYQLDQLDDKTGVLSDFMPTSELTGGTLYVQCVYTYMEIKGCSFSPEKERLSINLTASAPVAYLCLVADKKTVTYDDDFSHEISGAKFEDGKSYPAADHIIYENESVALVHAVSSLDNLVGIIGVFNYRDGGSYTYTSNCIGKGKSLSMDASKNIQYLDEGHGYPFQKGDSYDTAFSKILGFLGDGKFAKGTWGVFQEFPQYWDADTEGGFSCTAVRFGPFAVINLRVTETLALRYLAEKDVDGGIYILMPKGMRFDHSMESGMDAGFVSGGVEYNFTDSDRVTHYEKINDLSVSVKSCKWYDSLNRVVLEITTSKNDIASATETYPYTVTGGNLNITMVVSADNM